MSLLANYTTLKRDPIPPPPPNYQVTEFAPLSPAGAIANARYPVLEPSAGGVDHAFSFSAWIDPHNYCDSTLSNRVFGVSRTGANTDQQWGLSINPYSSQSNSNQSWQFTIFGPAMASFIAILTQGTSRAPRGRWSHVCGTYSGNEANTGLNLYVNGVLQTDVLRATSGAYAGAYDNAGLRMQLSTLVTGVGELTGRMGRLSVWPIELTQAQVNQLYNGGVPIDVETVSFYSSIGAYWPLKTNIACLNNGSMNFGSPAGITFGSWPIDEDYPYISCFNAYPQNSRYLAFGSLYRESDSLWRIYQRSGTDHITAGKIVKLQMTVPADGIKFMMSGAPVDCITDGVYDLRNACAGVISGSVYVFSSRYDTGTMTFISTDYYVSTDGLVGETFAPRVDVTALLPSVGLTCGKIMPGPGSGEFMVGVYGQDGANYWFGYLKRSVAGVWSYVPAYYGATYYAEPAFLNCGGGRLLCLLRNGLVGIGLYLSRSADSGVTWSAPVSTGLGVGTCMADMCLTNLGQIALLYADRGTGQMVISLGNVVDDLFADATDWSAGSILWKNYPFNGLSILGSPVIQPFGAMGAFCFSSEFSDPRADLIMGYGQIQY